MDIATFLNYFRRIYIGFGNWSFLQFVIYISIELSKPQQKANHNRFLTTNLLQFATARLTIIKKSVTFIKLNLTQIPFMEIMSLALIVAYSINLIES